MSPPANDLVLVHREVTLQISTFLRLPSAITSSVSYFLISGKICSWYVPFTHDLKPNISFCALDVFHGSSHLCPPEQCRLLC